MSETFQPRIVQHQFAEGISAQDFADTDKLRLYQNDLVPAPTTVIADITEADFTGYAPITLNQLFLSFVDPANRGQLVYPLLSFFLQTGVVIVNNVFGWYITNTGGTILRVVKRLTIPASFDLAGNSLALKLILFNSIIADSEEEFLQP